MQEQTAKLNAALKRCAESDEVKAVIVTGHGRYYSAGADFSASVRPQALHATSHLHLRGMSSSLLVLTTDSRLFADAIHDAIPHRKVQPRGV